MAMYSEQPSALGRRTARTTASLRLPGMRRIDGFAVAAEVLENPLYHRRILDAGDHPQRRQTSRSMAKTRLRRCAQVRARCRSVADASSLSLASLAAAA
jgi:hypothetical protein